MAGEKVSEYFGCGIEGEGCESFLLTGLVPPGGSGTVFGSRWNDSPGALLVVEGLEQVVNTPDDHVMVGWRLDFSEDLEGDGGAEGRAFGSA